MEENPKSFEALIAKATEYGKTSFELAKLKALDKGANLVSSIITHFILLVLATLFLLFLSLGLALWLGTIMEWAFLGFVIVGAFYGCLGIVLHFLLQQRIKSFLYNFILKIVQN